MQVSKVINREPGSPWRQFACLYAAAAEEDRMPTAAVWYKLVASAHEEEEE